MAKPRIPNQRNANLAHKKRVEKYAVLIQRVYDKIAQQASLVTSLSDPDTEKLFSFSDYPMAKEAIKRLQLQLISDVSGIIMSGTSAEWKESNLVQDLVAKKVLTAYTGTNKHGEEFTRYFQTNPEALKAFQQRRDEGMNLSTRLLNLSEQYKEELEESITAAIAPGMPAVELAAEIKKYLKEPDKRFRRIKEKMDDGTIKWHLSNPAKEYHPGQGVYRSSARNAQRLARTEINMAYRTAEQERWKQFDFVVGYEVKTTQNGHHVEDICDQLAGKYPKDFVFKGWHPQCLCYTIPILKTEEEFWSLDDTKSVNEITELPSNFCEWIDNNRDRIEAAETRGKLPYFLRDNRDTVENILNPKLKEGSIELPALPNYGAAMKFGRSATKEAMKIVENIGAPELSEIQKKNIRELADALGIPKKELKPMSFIDADQGASNPTKDESNCQSCVIAFSARRRGIDCFAKAYDELNPSKESFQLGERFQDGWLNAKTGKPIQPTVLRGRNDEEIIAKLKRTLSQPGEYVLGINGKDGEGHVVNVINHNGNIIIHDEQAKRESNRYRDIDSFMDIDYMEIIRIDKAILNTKIIKCILHH